MTPRADHRLRQLIALGLALLTAFAPASLLLAAPSGSDPARGQTPSDCTLRANQAVERRGDPAAQSGGLEETLKRTGLEEGWQPVPRDPQTAGAALAAAYEVRDDTTRPPTVYPVEFVDLVRGEVILSVRIASAGGARKVPTRRPLAALAGAWQARPRRPPSPGWDGLQVGIAGIRFLAERADARLSHDAGPLAPRVAALPPALVDLVNQTMAVEASPDPAAPETLRHLAEGWAAQARTAWLVAAPPDGSPQPPWPEALANVEPLDVARAAGSLARALDAAARGEHQTELAQAKAMNPLEVAAQAWKEVPAGDLTMVEAPEAAMQPPRYLWFAKAAEAPDLIPLALRRGWRIAALFDRTSPDLIALPDLLTLLPYASTPQWVTGDHESLLLRAAKQKGWGGKPIILNTREDVLRQLGVTDAMLRLDGKEATPLPRSVRIAMARTREYLRARREHLQAQAVVVAWRRVTAEMLQRTLLTAPPPGTILYFSSGSPDSWQWVIPAALRGWRVVVLAHAPEVAQRLRAWLVALSVPPAQYVIETALAPLRDGISARGWSDWNEGVVATGEAARSVLSVGREGFLPKEMARALQLTRSTATAGLEEGAAKARAMDQAAVGALRAQVLEAWGEARNDLAGVSRSDGQSGALVVRMTPGELSSSAAAFLSMVPAAVIANIPVIVVAPDAGTTGALSAFGHALLSILNTLPTPKGSYHVVATPTEAQDLLRTRYENLEIQVRTIRDITPGLHTPNPISVTMAATHTFEYLTAQAGLETQL
ncbi:MAG: hypothetical protein A3C53_08730 [Omnitrophica WOR_2 bacterium RIFCSPHIGHO2_02_FULL_68_15]|nr:MAG: hypothetical protein A3C53_08730 [Omnitrophica WOR_2 bacterium RIFCSPHIGHO2_02_FULL_68_15]